MTSGRTPLLAAAAALAALAACSGGDPGTAPPEAPAPRPSPAEASTEPSEPSEPPGLPEPPGGTRWVGAGRLLVAVPAGWPTEVGPCGPEQPRVVHVATDSATLDCVRAPGSAPGIAVTDWSTASLRPVGGTWTDVDGVPVRTATTCELSDPAASCAAAAGSAAARAVVRTVTVRPRAEEEAAAFLGTLRLVPDGWVTVPPVLLGTPVARADRLLEAAGLEARLPQVDWPHYALSTVPPAGTPVPVGSTVEVLPGDG